MATAILVVILMVAIRVFTIIKSRIIDIMVITTTEQQVIRQAIKQVFANLYYQMFQNQTSLQLITITAKASTIMVATKLFIIIIAVVTIFDV